MKSVKSLLSLSISVIFVCVICSLSYAGPTNQPAVLDVFADSSLESALKSISEKYSTYHQAIINFKFADSEELAKYIREGEACDVFITSDSNYLDASNIDLLKKDHETRKA